MSGNPYLKMLTDEFGRYDAMLLALERGELFSGDPDGNQARMQFLRGQLIVLDAAVQAERDRNREGA